MPSLPVPVVTLSSLQERLAPTGLNLVGATTAMAFDAAQPTGRRIRELAPRCGTLVVVASGGPAFWQHCRAESGQPGGPPGASYESAADRCARLAADARAWLDARGVRAELACPARNPNFNFVQMAEMAGLGVVSPVSNWLMHPHYGPWVGVRFALLLDGMPLGSVHRRLAGEYLPCDGCHQPCVEACPADVCASGTFDDLMCRVHRRAGGCNTGCGMKMACPRGADHRYGEDEERYRQAAVERAARALGWWKFVPKGMRPGG